MKNAFPLACLVSLTMLACASNPAGTTPDRQIKSSDSTSKIVIDPFVLRPITVFVVADQYSEDLAVDQEPIHRRRFNRDVIVFKQSTEGYSFPKDAVTFSGSDHTPDGAIRCETQSDTEVRCTNAHEAPRKYEYTLRLLNVTSGRVLELDPFIVNH
jgi:hypothetical protein